MLNSHFKKTSREGGSNNNKVLQDKNIPDKGAREPNVAAHRFVQIHLELYVQRAGAAIREQRIAPIRIRDDKSVKAVKERRRTRLVI